MGTQFVPADALRAAVESVADATGCAIAMPRWTSSDGSWWATVERRSDGAVVDYLAIDATVSDDGAAYTCRGDHYLIAQLDRELERRAASERA